MASTNTNKQPLLVDRVFHNHVDTIRMNSGSVGLDIIGSNNSGVLVDCTTNDGGVVEDLYCISRGAVQTGPNPVPGSQYRINFYMSPSVDYLRPDQAIYVGSLTASKSEGEFNSVSTLPKVLAPLPHTGSESQVGGWYIPRGKALWVTLRQELPKAELTAPIVGCQGGFY